MSDPVRGLDLVEINGNPIAVGGRQRDRSAAGLIVEASM